MVRSGQDTIRYLQPEHRTYSFLDKIAAQSRVLIIEGVSGSGKDTLQSYLRNQLSYRDVYDYSEGELLQSWNHLQIDGICKLRISFMKLFVRYIKKVLDCNENAMFLLNRFHLSVYAMTIVQQPKLEKEYNEIIHALRMLPVHVFILLLPEHEIEQRSLHPERSSTWRKFQEDIVKREGFRNRVERYIFQQQMMLRSAEKQQIPYSIIAEFDGDARSTNRRQVRANSPAGKSARARRQQELTREF